MLQFSKGPLLKCSRVKGALVRPFSTLTHYLEYLRIQAGTLSRRRYVVHLARACNRDDAHGNRDPLPVQDGCVDNIIRLS